MPDAQKWGIFSKFYCIFINKGKCPMSHKMPIFPKKALKMPGWQHCCFAFAVSCLCLVCLKLSAPQNSPHTPYNCRPASPQAPATESISFAQQKKEKARSSPALPSFAERSISVSRF